jgi:ubiquinol-cytochrome c reductase cytochrome b subunit
LVEARKKKGVLDPLVALLRWAWDRLERTILLALKIVFPSRFISPLGFLGMLTTIVFIILGVTGALLLFYYIPLFGDCATATAASCNQAYNSVGVINDQVGWGFMVRNVHYHASNAMVLLAVMHMFYQYFSGRYKLRYEMLWVTGIILGVITIVEAYSGYDLIFNIRGQLAINIGRTLTLNTPVIGADLAQIVFGFSSNDLTLRFYALHVFIIPIIMLALMSVHLPKNLVLDIPVASAITGVIFIMGGLFPVELGIKFVAGQETQITFPEWYFTSLYAFLRVNGVNAVLGGIILPTVFILIFLVIPFFDRGKKIAMIDRPFWIALGVAALGQMAIVTVWGFRADNPFSPLKTPGQLVIDPSLLFGSMLIASAVAYGFVYSFVRWRRVKVEHLKAQRKPVPFRRVPPYILNKGETYSLFAGLLVLQAFLDISIFRAVLVGLRNFALIEIGMVLVAFAATYHIYRVTSSAK